MDRDYSNLQIRKITEKLPEASPSFERDPERVRSDVVRHPKDGPGAADHSPSVQGPGKLSQKQKSNTKGASSTTKKCGSTARVQPLRATRICAAGPGQPAHFVLSTSSRSRTHNDERLLQVFWKVVWFVVKGKLFRLVYAGSWLIFVRQAPLSYHYQYQYSFSGKGQEEQGKKKP